MTSVLNFSQSCFLLFSLHCHGGGKEGVKQFVGFWGFCLYHYTVQLVFYPPYPPHQICEVCRPCQVFLKSTYTIFPLVHTASHAGRVIRHNLSLINLCWLLTTTFVHFIFLDMTSRRICSLTFPRTEARLTSL